MRTSPPLTRANKDVAVLLIGLLTPSFLLMALLLQLIPEQPMKELYAVALSVGLMALPIFTAVHFWDRTIRAEEGATTDVLSGLFNRRGAQAALQMEFGLISRERSPKTVDPIEVSVIMIDLDHFKPLNDQCGHKAGDEALRVISRHIRETFHRKTDICCRYGGDEFVIILPKTPIEAAHAMTEHLRQSVEQTYAHEKVRITLSCGIASKPMAPAELLRNAAGDEVLGMVGPLLEVADQALYLSKERGRNQVTAHAGTMTGDFSPYVSS